MVGAPSRLVMVTVVEVIWTIFPLNIMGQNLKLE